MSALEYNISLLANTITEDTVYSCDWIDHVGNIPAVKSIKGTFTGPCNVNFDWSGESATDTLLQFYGMSVYDGDRITVVSEDTFLYYNFKHTNGSFLVIVTKGNHNTLTYTVESSNDTFRYAGPACLPTIPRIYNETTKTTHTIYQNQLLDSPLETILDRPGYTVTTTDRTYTTSNNPSFVNHIRSITYVNGKWSSDPIIVKSTDYSVTLDFSAWSDDKYIIIYAYATAPNSSRYVEVEGGSGAWYTARSHDDNTEIYQTYGITHMGNQSSFTAHVINRSGNNFKFCGIVIYSLS